MKKLFTLLTLLLLVGCTITKRHFGPGYYVEWKKSYSKSEYKIDQLNKTDSDPSIIPDENEVIPEEIIPADSITINELISSDNSEFPIEEQTGVSETPVEFRNKLVIRSDHILNDEEPLEQPERKVEPFTWLALGGILLGIFLALISFLVTTPEIVLGIVTGVGILVIIFSITSVVRIHRDPSKYKGKGLTWTLFGLSTAGIGVALFLLIAFILYATKSADLF
jgi:hypothetical protein